MPEADKSVEWPANFTSYTVLGAKIKAYRATKNVVSKALKQFDITILEWLAIGSLATKDSAGSVSYIARTLDVSMPFATRLISILQRKGLVLRSINAADKRGRTLDLTPKAEQLLTNSEPLVRAALKEWLSPIDRADVAAYIRTLLTVTKLE
jgi:DNA-binding MarR family transcriptional regulator